MTDVDILAEAKRNMHVDDIELMHGIVKDLIDLAEKYQAIATEERVKVIMLIEKLQTVVNDPDWESKGLKHDYDYYSNQARQELALETSNWHKIEKEEDESIKAMLIMIENELNENYSIEHLEKLERHAIVLRRLIGEDDK